MFICITHKMTSNMMCGMIKDITITTVENVSASRSKLIMLKNVEISGSRTI